MNQQEKKLSAREKLEKRFGKNTRMGGKGSQRLSQKSKKKTKTSDDKAIKGLVSKMGAQQLPDISNINFFTNDNQVIQFDKPNVFGSFQNKTLICSGTSTKKDIKDCFAEVMTEISPKQLEQLKKEKIIPEGEVKEEKKEEEKKPELANFEDEAKKNQ